MLEIVIPSCEYYDDNKEEFIVQKQQTLQLEHSLVSISKWESKWNKPFLVNETKTTNETIDYIRCMTISPNIKDNIYTTMSNDNVELIKDYIAAPMTATIIKNSNNQINRDTITSEIIYYWMISLTIPFECQKWHLNRLLTLINVCNIKNTPPKKMSRKEVINRNSRLNELRKQNLNTKG